MKNICDGCPQFDRVCDGKNSENKDYCFYWHGTNNPQYFQSNELSQLLTKAKEIFDVLGEYKSNGFKLVEYGRKNFCLLKLINVNDLSGIPIGYIKIKGA